MSNLLHDEYPIVVSPKLAEKIGLNEAIFLQQLNYWVNKSTTEIDGKKWVYNTIQSWAEQFPFWSEKTIKRVIVSLKNSGIIDVKKLSKDKRDKTNFYSINYEKIVKSDSDPSIGSSCPYGTGQNDHMDKDRLSTCINSTETTTETTTENKLSVSFFFSDNKCHGKNGECKRKSAMTINGTHYCSQHGRMILSELGRLDLFRETKKEFSFALRKKQSYDNLSAEYKEKLKAKCLLIDGSTSRYEDFITQLEAKGYQYKDFSKAYMAWDREKAYKDFTPEPEPALGEEWVKVRLSENEVVAINTETLEMKHGKISKHNKTAQDAQPQQSGIDVVGYMADKVQRF